MGSWPRLLTLFNFLELTVILTPPFFLGMMTRGLENGEEECWIRPAARYWSKIASTCLESIVLMRYSRDVTGGVPGGNEILNESTEQDPKSVFDFENTAGKSRNTAPSSAMTVGVQPGPCRSKLMSYWKVLPRSQKALALRRI